jgi:internalin A
MMPLKTLWVASTKITDLSPLVGKDLTSLDVEKTPVNDLSVLSGMSSLRRLNIAEAAVTDLTPLARVRLERLIFTPSRIENGLDVVRQMPTLQTLGTNFDRQMPAAEFWKALDAGQLD